MLEKGKWGRDFGILSYIDSLHPGAFALNRLERVHKIDEMIMHKGCVPVHDFLSALNISLATFKRDLDYLRETLHAPIQWRRELGGYTYAAGKKRKRDYQLPKLWFNSTEILALLSIKQALKQVKPGVLWPQVQALQSRVSALCSSQGDLPSVIEKRICLSQADWLTEEPPCFETVANAVVKRHQLQISLVSRSGKRTVQRQISPQRLTLTGQDWWLESVAHPDNERLLVKLSDIESAQACNEKAKEVSLKATKGSAKK